jgi:excinuclease ABC subunit B
VPRIGAGGQKAARRADPDIDLAERLEALRQQMFVAAENLEFETAARIRDDIRRLQSGEGGPAAAELAMAVGAGRPNRRSKRPGATTQRRRKR